MQNMFQEHQEIMSKEIKHENDVSLLYQYGNRNYYYFLKRTRLKLWFWKVQ